MKYPIGIQTFENIVSGGYAYVDKTAYVHDLATNLTYCFLSRPRRFGKSLLVSTFEAYFRSRRELFSGLAIEGLERSWEAFPVLRLDLSKADYSSPGKLSAVLSAAIDSWEREYGLAASCGSPDVRFDLVIRGLAKMTGKKVVVLIDEYDAPLVNVVHKPKLLEENRELLSGFYKDIKANDADIRFAFLTGVTKFGHLNVFSALNNLFDISMLPQYASVCGITAGELHSCFDGGVAELAAANGLSREECYAELADMYDGYHFGGGSEGVYNPFSVLNTLYSKQFGSYWFATGTPTALLRALRDTKADLSAVSGNVLDVSVLQSINSYQDDIIPLLYQSGYLTVTKTIDAELVMVDFPNKEVRNGYMKQLLPLYSELSSAESSSLAGKMRLSLMEGDVTAYMRQMQSLISSLSYRFFKSSEAAYQFIFLVAGELVGMKDLRTEVEKETNRGRIDMVMLTERFVYVFEFKHDSSPLAALGQIRERNYAAQWKADGRRKFLVGVNFSSELRNIPDDGWLVEEFV